MSGLNLLKARAKRRVDQHAGAIRMIFITDIPGQQAVYMSKLQQAREFMAEAGNVPPYIAAEAATTGLTPLQVAEWIISTAAQWNDVIGPGIESARLQGKRNIDAAVDEAGIEQAEMAVVEQLNALVA